MRLVWAGLGLIALVLGIIGIPAPFLPSVPFLLLAAFCFARSSDRLHRWLITHPILGPPISDWQRSGAIGRKAKVLATVSILAGFSVSLALGLGWQILLAQAIVLLVVAVFIWSRPEPLC